MPAQIVSSLCFGSHSPLVPTRRLRATKTAAYSNDMVDFFTSFEWWKMEPHDELVDDGNYCLAKPGETYAVYLPSGGKVTVKLEPGRYTAIWFGAVTGEKLVLPSAQGLLWTSPEAPDRNDWALLLSRE